MTGIAAQTTTIAMYFRAKKHGRFLIAMMDFADSTKFSLTIAIQLLMGLISALLDAAHPLTRPLEAIFLSGQSSGFTAPCLHSPSLA